MPINVTTQAACISIHSHKKGMQHSPMDDPRTGVVSLEADRGVVSGDTSVDNIAANGVDIVVNGASCAANDGERVLDHE